MLGDINKNLQPREINLFICKPNKEIVGKLHHAYNQDYIRNLGSLNELTFDMPYQIWSRGKFIDYKQIDNIKSRYVVKAVVGSDEEYFVINEIVEQDTGNNGESLSVHAFSLGYQLTDKMIHNYQSTDGSGNASPINIMQAMDDALSQSYSWSVGDVDASLLNKFRSFNFTSTTALDFINQIATSFSAIIEWDTINKKINMKDPDNVGQNKGLQINRKKYLSSISKDTKPDQMATRLNCYGQNNISIQDINPTGSPYIEDYSFFLYPFERDENKNVIQNSYWMSDALAGSLLDYEAKVAANSGNFSDLLNQETQYQTDLTSLNNDMTVLQTQMSIIQNNLDVQRADETFTYYDFTYTGSPVTKKTDVDASFPYAVMFYASGNANGLTVDLNGSPVSVDSSKWDVIGKVSGNSSVSVEIQGSPTDLEIDMYVVQITSDEFLSGNSTDILSNYNDSYQQGLIDAKQADIDAKQAQIDDVQSQIASLQSDLAVENNFTQDELDEWDNFIIERDFSDQNYYDSNDLYEEGKKQLANISTPPIALTIGIIDFLKVVEAQRDWDKLVVGDIVNIKHDKLDINIQAKITKIEINYQSNNINLTIANVKEVLTDEQKFIQTLYQSVSTSTTVTSKKSDWNKVTQVSDDFNQYINNAIDATKQAILAGTNQSVQMNDKGLTILDPKDPNNYLIANNSVLAITNDGGKTWKNALTKNGLIAERVIGKLIIGEQLQISNASGNLTFDLNGLTVEKADNTAKILLNPSDGIKIQQKISGNWTDQFYVDDNGLLTTSGIAVIGGSITGTTVSGSTIISSDSSGDKVILDTGSIQTYQDGRMMAKIQNYVLSMYDPGTADPSPDYGVTGRLESGWTSNGTKRGIILAGYKDYISIGKQVDSTDYKSLIYSDFSDHFMNIMGSTSNLSGNLYLSSSYDMRSSELTINNYNDSTTRWSTISAYVGRDREVPGQTTQRFGFEVWQYNGTNDGAKTQLLRIDKKPDGTFMGAYTDEAYLPAKTYLDSNSSGYWLAMGMTPSDNLTGIHGSLNHNGMMFLDTYTMPFDKSYSYNYVHYNFSGASNIFFVMAQPYGNGSINYNARAYNISHTGFDLYVYLNQPVSSGTADITVQILVVYEPS